VNSRDDSDVLALLRTPPALDDPYRLYARLRDTRPVMETSTGVYVLTRYADCVQLLKDDATFRGPGQEEMRRAYPRAGRHLSLQVLISENLLGLSGRDHTRLRACLARALTPRRVDALRPAVEALASRHVIALADSLRGGGTADMHALVSVSFPLAVIARLAGLPAGDLPWYAQVLPRVLKSGDPAATEEELTDSDGAVADLRGYIVGMASERRRHPGDDLISALASMRELSEAEMVMLTMALLIGGHETTAAAIDNGTLALLHTGGPGAWRHAPAEGLTREMLRYDSPAQCNPGIRLTTRPVVIGGVPIPAGRDVRAVIGAANRDPAVYFAPDEFDPGREGAPSLTFGTGRHFCPGSALAQLEMRALFSVLTAQLPGLALAAPPDRRPSAVLRAVDRLPVTLG
jgi:cytochrome P450 family 114